MKNKGKKIWSFVIAAVIVVAGAVYGIDFTMDGSPQDSGSGAKTAESSQSVQQSEPAKADSEDFSAAKTAQDSDQTVSDHPSQSAQNAQSSSQSAQNVQPSSQTDQNAKNIQAAKAGTLDFRSEKLLAEHFEKHGIEMGFSSEDAYLKAARRVVANSESLHKLEAEDGDDVYYLESTNEFVIVSTDGYLRTYFYPNGGIDYFNRQRR